MEEVFKKFKYLQCDPKYRVNRRSLEKVIAKARESGLLENQPWPKVILEGDELSELLSGNEMLISVCRPIMARVFDSLTDKSKLLFLCDSRGYIIDLYSSMEVMQWCFNRGIMPGACLDYYSFGTNSISMAIYENSPTVIIGDEHYCSVMKSWSCIAAPIRVAGETVGYIDISAGADSDLVQLTALVELMAELAGSYMETTQGSCRPRSYSHNTEDDNHNTKGNNHNTRGEHYNSSGVAGKSIDKAMFFGKIIISRRDLTVREVEVLYELYCGKNQERVSGELNISKNTIKCHLKNIYQKLGVGNFGDCMAKVKDIVWN
ncbi:transcriptional regulator, LuxR family [Thermincola ferriacetica]|uniref:Transcriptional regulator, LuxR family n=1 Tax=Thermincola ferriacetica TaxID=281456 RepID=A0A0L6W0W1_9FIRM|nr:LuxR C-terminal-related transcriptional regulator [Thermincola ferriacetica]KNZ68719.1 transcriptional regulator, LuxR family [Thermincola ferriacetica]